MATVIPLNHQIIDDKTGNHFVISKINYDGTETTIDVAEGLVDAAVLAASSSVTKPTVSITQNDISDDGTAPVVTLAAGGDIATLYVISRHIGNAAGL